VYGYDDGDGYHVPTNGTIKVWKIAPDGIMTLVAPLNSGPFEIMHESSSVVCADGSIVVVGASDAGTPARFVLSGAPGGELVELAASVPRLYACVVQVEDGFSVVGGALYDADEGVAFYHHTYHSVERCQIEVKQLENTHDLIVGQHTQSKAPMPVSKAWHSGAFGADKRLYIGGGINDPWTGWSNLIAYDATGWNTVPNSNDFAFTQSAMVAYGRYIVTVGGVLGWREPEKTCVKSGQVMLYDTRGGTFHRLPSLQTPRRGHKIAVCGTKLFVLGDGPPEVIQLPPLAGWTPDTTQAHSFKFRRALFAIMHSCARSNALNDDCIVIIISFLDALDFDT